MPFTLTLDCREKVHEMFMSQTRSSSDTIGRGVSRGEHAVSDYQLRE